MKKIINNDSRRNQFFFLALCFFSLFFYCIGFIGTSFEVTDTGFNLTNHMALIEGWKEYLFGPLWLADIIGAAWMGLVGQTLWMARLGWCILIGLSGILCYRFLLHFTLPVYAFLISFFVGLVMIPGRIMVLYYTNLSGFFLMIFAYLTYLSGKEEKPPPLLILLTGLAASLAIMTRLPSALALFCFPLIILVYIFFEKGKLSKKSWKTAMMIFFSGMTFSALLLGLLAALGHGSEFYENTLIVFGMSDRVPLQSEHGFGHLIALYWRQFTWKIGEGLGLTMIILTAFSSLLLHRKFQKKIVFIGSLVAVFVVQSLFLFGLLDNDENNFRVIVGSSLIILSIFHLIYSFVGPIDKQTRANRIFIILLFLATALITFAGSNVGLLNMSKGLWLLMVGCLFLTGWIFEDKEQGRKKISLVTLALLGPLGFKSYLIRMDSPYRDYPMAHVHQTEIDHPLLRGIKTTPARAKNFGEFLKEASKIVQPGDYLLSYNSIPMMHYLLKAKPYLKYSWPGIQGKEAVEILLESPNSEKPPKVVLRSLTNTESMDWGNGRFVPPHNPVHLEGVKTLDLWVKKQGYSLIWKNRDFAIFSLNNP